MPVSADLFNGYYRVAPVIEHGATVFIGEQGLDISPAMTAANVNGVPTAITTIGWWASAADIRTTVPTKSIDLAGREKVFSVDQAEFDGYEGEWYLVDASDNYMAKAGTGAVFNVKAPKLEISIHDPNQNDGADVSGTSVPQGTQLQFQIGTNMYTAIMNPLLRSPVYGVGGTGVNTDGYLDILIKTGSGTVLERLYTSPGGQFSDLTGLNVDTQPYTWGRERNGKGPGSDWTWDSSAVNPITKEIAYPAGTYTVSVQSNLNNMKQNYLSGTAAYTGRTVSQTKTITLVTKTNEATITPTNTPTPIPTPIPNPTTVRTIVPTTVPTTVQSTPSSLPPSNSGATILTSASAGDTMFRANPEHTGVYNNGGIVTTNTELWRFVTGGYSSSDPTVSNGVVYVGSDVKNLWAIDAVTGVEKWRFPMGNSVSSSPAVSNGIVYVGSDDNNLYAVDAVTGTEKWRFETKHEVRSSPAVSNGIVYFASIDNNLYAIDAVTGVEKWRFGTTAGYSYSSPAVSNGVVYIGSYKNLYAIDAVTGVEKWRFEMGSWWSSSPAVSNGVVYVGNQDKNLYAIDAVTGTEKWRFEPGGSGFYLPSSPSVSNGVVYIWSNNNLWAIGEAPTSQLNTQTTASIQTVTTNQAAVTTTFPTPEIDSTSQSLPTINSKYSILSLPIIVILALFLIAGGGYMIYRMKKKPSGYQPPKRKEKKSTAPHPPPTVSTTKPELTLTLDRNRLIADDWDRMTIQLANRGDGHARDVRLTFSEEFDTKWIKPAMINAGATTLLDIGIRPKVKGKIPLEVTAMYHDVYGKEFRETHEFWIDVVEKDTTTSPPSETPSSPVSQFTPRPLTPKQLPPDLSDRYTESEFIGKGGFARVFKAKRKDGKYVAVKIPISLDAMTGKSFIAEMQNWTKLSHPNIVRLYDFNIMPMPFFEEELCDSALSDMEKPLESEEAAWILFNICEGLKFAHTHKIIHRDLKPQNILLKNGVPKISDWGLSKIISESTTTTITSFTPFYAAPEQINGRAKDERTDIWQLGVILYELVTGILPFTGDSMVEIGMNIATKDPTRPGEIKPDAKVIDVVVMKCLQKNPATRYQSVLELQKDLALYLRENYTELLKTSVTAKDYTRSAYYCGDLVMINMLTGDIPTAYKYLLDLVLYSKGDVKAEARELSEQLKMRMEMGVIEIPEELIQKAEMVVHLVSVGFRNRG